MGVCWFLVIGSILSIVSATLKFHETLDVEDLQHYFGTALPHEVPDYEIIHPIHVSGSRHRRSLDGPKPPLKYELKALGEKYNLHLNHNDVLVAPGCLVSHLGSDEVVVPCPTKETDCFYHGVSTDHEGSTVSVSTCRGLHGIISTASHDLLIQPIRAQHLQLETRNMTVAHLAYRRNARNKRSCPLQVAADAITKPSSKHRIRRTAGKLTIEMLLVADKTMYAYHGDGLTNYMLTTANIAAARFLDPTLGTKVYLAIVRIKILKDDQPGLNIVLDSDWSLKSFCHWQEKFNPDNDNAAGHVDAASLMTRRDFRYKGVQTISGLATFENMCVKNTRCSIIRDSGLIVGLTLAHETGHSLGMEHDHVKNNCSATDNIMAAKGGLGPRALRWSSCSAQYLLDFLSAGIGNCLNDEPRGKVNLPKDLPGVIYSADEQCEFFLGEGSTLCVGTGKEATYGDECSILVCFDPGRPGQCKLSYSSPRLDGTECGKDKWCQGGRCVDIGPNGPKPQNGGWSDYTKTWTTCSRTCGGGVRYRSRTCTNPRPRFGGATCNGSSELGELCNMKDCPTSQFAFKKEQCAATDNIKLNGQLYSWVPASSSGGTSSVQCHLGCVIGGGILYQRRTLNGSQNYKDGTKCEVLSGTYGRCIRGKCMVFGCDGVSNSGMTNDKCGVCNGKGDTCQTITGTFTQEVGKQYTTVLKLPKGASEIKIINKNRNCFLNVKVGGNQIFNWRQDRSGMYSLGSVHVDYTAPQRYVTEKLKIVGRQSVDVEVQVYRFAGNGNSQISYEYVIPSVSSNVTFVWRKQTGTCSATCGEGVTQFDILCVRSDSGSIVDNFHCDLTSKPDTTGNKCVRPPCTPRWKIGSFSTCSKTCGGGNQTRTVECARGPSIVSDGECVSTKPTSHQVCATENCPGEWRYSIWSACLCSEGVQYRNVACYLNNQQVADEKCIPSAKPSTTQTCQEGACSTNGPCTDKLDCSVYGMQACNNSKYRPYMETNCPRFCQFCVSLAQSTSTAAPCMDKEQNCQGYGADVCTKFAAWSKINCRSFCGHCATSAQSTSTAAPCKDKTPDCQKHGADVCTKYADWSKINGRSFCGHCDECREPCQDVNTQCAQRSQTVCTEYKDWSFINCQKYCKMC